MWFLFGFITLGAACISSLIWRRTVSWHGSQQTSQGIGYEYAATTAKGRVRMIRVGVSCGEGFTFSLKPEGTLDRWSKGIGLTQECQTGDHDFDQALYVLSDDPVLHRVLRMDAGLRANVMRLVGACAVAGRLKMINVHLGRLWVVVDPTTTDREEAKAAARGIVPALDHLAADFAGKAIPVRDDRDPFPLRAACVLAVSTGLAINGAFELVRSYTGDFPFLVDSFAPLPLALLLGLTAVVALIAFAIWLMGRSSRTHLVLIELLIVGSFGAVTSAYAELRDYNAEFDTAPPQVHRATITGTYETHGKRRHCHVRMRGWPYEDREDSREMSCSFYEAVTVGTPIDVKLRAGALGWPWVETFVIR